MLDVLTDIYKDDVNIVIWKRTLSSKLLNASEEVIKINQDFQFSAVVTSKNTFNSLYHALGKTNEAKVIH